MLYPYRKRYEIDIEVEHLSLVERCLFSKEISLKFRQASWIDTMEFIEVVGKGEEQLISDYVYSFVIDNKVKGRLNESIFMKNFKRFLDIVQHCYFKGVFKQVDESKKSTGEPGYLPAEIIFLSEKLNIDPNTLIEEYTFEQITWLSKGISYIQNEYSEEGKKENRRIRNRFKDENMSDTEKEKRTNAMSKFKENLEKAKKEAKQNLDPKD